ncbi:hypothetical protein ACET3Z_025874 [Daucus carota]
MVRELFFMAREHAPSIIFMDEIDSIGSARMESDRGNGDSEVQSTMLELLNQLDRFESSNKIKEISLHIKTAVHTAKVQSCIGTLVQIRPKREKIPQTIGNPDAVIL